MVHSGFTSPMNTTSALNLPATPTAPPVAPTPAISTDQTDIKPTPHSDSTIVSTFVHDNHESPFSNELASKLTHSQPVFNGRTSGRKRTPKSCDCCGPNSRGHNVQPSSRGRGRGRGRPRVREPSINLENSQRKQVGRFTAPNQTIDLPKTNLSEAEGTKMGNNSPSHNSTEIHIPEIERGTEYFIPPAVTYTQKEERLIAKSTVKSNDFEMEALDKTKEGSVCNQALGSPLSTTGDTKRKNEDNFFNSSTNLTVLSIVNKQAKLEPEVQAGNSSHIVNLTPPSNGLRRTHEDDSKLQVKNGPVQSGTKAEDTSTVDMILIDHFSDKTNSVSSTLSNGDAAKSTDQTQEVTVMDSETSRLATVPPPSHGPISVNAEQHPAALQDHWMYCQSGTWDKVDMTEETDGEQLNSESQIEKREQLLDLVHEFLESFYVKYGSFIPLAEADVVEHLKKKGTTDLENKGLDIKKEVKLYRAGLASVPVAGFMVAHNKHTLSLEDLSTLEEQNWINDQIINMYGELIMEATEQRVHFFNSFFHKQLVAKGYEGVKRWTKKIDLFSKWLVLIPIHLEIHWSLVTVSMAHKTISYYDSQGIVFRHTTENIMKYLLAEAKEKKQTGFQKGWKITIIKGIPQQKNDSDCGVFVLEYCRCLSVKQPFRFSQEDMPRIRKRIYKELCDCGLDV